MLPYEVLRLRVVGEQPVDLFVREGGGVVLDDGPGDVVAVRQSVDGRYRQSVRLVPIADDRRPREGVQRWGIAPPPPRADPRWRPKAEQRGRLRKR